MLVEEQREESSELEKVFAQIEARVNRVVEGSYKEKIGDRLKFDVVEEGGSYELWVSPPDYDPTYSYDLGEKALLWVEPPSEFGGGVEYEGSVRKAEKLSVWNELLERSSDGKEVEGEIIGVTKGRISVALVGSGVKVSVPRSKAGTGQRDWAELKDVIGAKDHFKIIDFDRKHGRLLGSREGSLKRLLGKQVKGALPEVKRELNVGDELDGVVTNVVEFGLFVDIGGGLEGMVHVSDVSWSRSDDPLSEYKVGDEVRVKVLRLKGKVKLGIKQLSGDPWESFQAEVKEGSIVTGRVVSVQNYGAFVELAPGVDGLLHVSELSWDRGNPAVEDVVKVGDEVQVRVLSIQSKGRKVALSIRACEENPWNAFAEGHKVGDVVRGKVTRIQRYGVFVEVAEGVVGRIRVEDLSWTKRIWLEDEEDAQEEKGGGLGGVNSDSDVDSEGGKEGTGSKGSKAGRRSGDSHFWHKVGDEVDVKILSIDKKSHRVFLGLKQLTEDPWKKIVRDIRVGSRIDVTISHLAEFGAFAKINDEIEGLIHISELSVQRVEKVRDVVKEGQQVSVLVLGIDTKERRISLSLSRDELDDGVPSEYYDAQRTTTSLGDLLREKLGLVDLDE